MMPGRSRLPVVAAVGSSLLWVAGSPGADGLPEWIEAQGGALHRSTNGKIVSIDLSRSWIGDIDVNRLAELAGLETLSLAQTHVTDDALRVVAALPDLRELDLFYCEHITDAGASLLRRAAALERLNVRGTKISDSGVQFLTELKSLRSLDIGIAEISDSSIELLEALPALETLAIGGNRVGEVGISSLRSLKQLRHLDLSGAQVTDSGIWAVTVTDLNLDEIAALTRLESLNLAAPSPEYVEAASAGVPRLRGAIRVTDFGARQLAKMKRLRRLNLSRSLLTSGGLRHLDALVHLEELNLAHSAAIDDSVGEALAGLPALRALDVSDTKFGDRSLGALNEHPSLTKLIVTDTLVTQQAVEVFLDAGRGRIVVR